MRCSLNTRRLVSNFRSHESASEYSPWKGATIMSTQLDEPLTPELRDTLTNLAAGLFGLDAWVKEPGKYKPNGDLPWRAAGHTFTPADLGVIPFFENLLRESSGDDDLGARWAPLGADALKYSPLPDPATWRKNRGLGATAKFGIAKSANVWLTDLSGNVISRATFYPPCWPLLKGVVDARKASGPVDWALLASDLLGNKALQWPNTMQPPSSVFLIQFASDMLYAMLGMRNSAPEPWRRAVSIELGEFRHPGNEYTSEDTDAAVKKFETVASI